MPRPHPPHPRLRPLLAALALLLPSAALAGACTEAVAAAAPPEGWGRGAVAAAWLAEAVALAEPALPPLRSSRALPGAAGGAPGGEAAAWLYERRMVRYSWSPDEMDAEAWSWMLRRWLRWYDLEPPPGYDLPLPDDPAAYRARLAHDLDRILDAVAETVRPVAVIASADGARDRAAFTGVLRPDRPYPRLIVVRPPEGAALADGPAALLPGLSTCAAPVTEWVLAPERTARALLREEADRLGSGGMLVLAGSPALPEGPFWVTAGDEERALAFELDDLAGVDAYAAVFDAEPPGPVRLARILPRVRTSLGPRDALELFRTR